MPEMRHVAPPKRMAAAVSSCLSIDGKGPFSYSGLKVTMIWALS